MKRIISTLCGLAILCLFANAHAVPGTVAFTGRLSTSAGPVNGNIAMTFTLYTAPTAGSSVWSEVRPTIAASNGLVYVDLGAATTLDDTVFDGAPLFLEIIIGTEVLSPRVPIRSVPYAFRAATADSADTLGTIAPGDVVTTVTASGGIAATRTGNTVSLTGTPITGTAPVAVTGSAVSLTTCAANQIYKMAGGVWACAADTDTNTTYAAIANAGILVNASNQIGLIATCAAGQVLKAGAGGTWACAADIDTNTTYTAAANGGILINASNQIGLIATCAAGQVLKAGAGGTWACAADTDTTYTAAASSGITVVSNQIGTDTTIQRRTAVTNNMTCPSGQYMRTIAQTGQVTCVPALSCTRLTGTADAATDTLTCAAGSVVVGGGCSVSGSTNAVLDSYPIATTQWFCRTVAAGLVTAYAICCDLSF